MTDYLEAEPLIIARLEAKLTTFKKVVGMPNIEEALEQQQILPAVFVIPLRRHRWPWRR